MSSPTKATKATTTTKPETKTNPGTTTLRLRRVIRAPAERIYQAFLDPDALAKWLPPHGFTCHVHHFEPKVGGTFRMSFATIDRKWSQAFGGTYLELKPNERIVHTDRFETDDPAMQGEMKVAITLKPVPGGTEIGIVQEGIPPPAADGAPEGWGQSLDNLQRLCEAELPF